MQKKKGGEQQISWIYKVKKNKQGHIEQKRIIQ